MSTSLWLEARRQDKDHDASCRTEFRRDRDAIFYSDAFRRLEDITQVARVAHIGTHNRMTHSLRVEQLTQSIISHLEQGFREQARQIGSKQQVRTWWRSLTGTQYLRDMVAGAALAHDLGHPPFGHTGEKALQEAVACKEHMFQPAVKVRREVDKSHSIQLDGRLARSSGVCTNCDLPDGFEGNAQTLRILSVTAIGSSYFKSIEKYIDTHGKSGLQYYGLNLSRGVLRTTVKTPWLRGANVEDVVKDTWLKWGAYDCDRGILRWIFADEAKPDGKDLESIDGIDSDQFAWTQTLASSIMDRSDEISYAVHDVDDFYRIGMIPFSQLADMQSASFYYFMQYITNEGAAVVGDNLFEFAQKYVSKYPSETSPDVEGDYRTTYDQISECLQHWPKKRFVGGARDVSWVSEARSWTLSSVVSRIQIEKNGIGRLRVEPSAKFIYDFLYQLLWYYVIDSDSMTAIREGQKTIIKQLYKMLLDQAKAGWNVSEARENGKAARRMPSHLIDILRINSLQREGFGSYGSGDLQENYTRARSVVDYICTLTDSEAYALHAKLVGDASFSKLTPMGG